MNNLNEYYSKRANDYEQIYHRNNPVRQSEQAKIKNLLRNSFGNKSVLEIACGTGYWTKAVAQTAQSITAVDNSTEMLEVAKAKNIKAHFINDNAYTLNNVNDEFNAGLANFWFSHIPKDQINIFLTTFHKKLLPGSTVIMAENILNKDIGGEYIKKDEDVNTYKLRTLNDGTTYQILKNYYNEEELLSIFKPLSSELKIHFGTCYWWIKYKITITEI
jgi:ubiquinone/menaquinone biosynthesis C-methylase UbiE